MSQSPITALKAALFGRLNADAGLTALLGGARVFDAAPRNPDYPFLVLAQLRSAPLLGHPDEGLVHEFVLAGFSREAGSNQAILIAERAQIALIETPLVLVDHHLVGLHCEAVSCRRLRDARTFRAEAALRAVTEPLVGVGG